MKLVRETEEIRIYSWFRDAYNNPCYVMVNDYLQELRIVAKNPEYKKRKCIYQKLKLNVVVPEFLEVIDITKQTEKVIKENFPGYKHTRFSVW